MAKRQRKSSPTNNKKTGNAALEAEVQRLQDILDNLSEGVMVADTEGRITWMNRTAREDLGVGVEGLDPKKRLQALRIYYADKQTPYDFSKLPLVRTSRGETVKDEMIYTFSGKDEGYFVNVNGRPLYDNNGQLTGGVISFRDVPVREKSRPKNAGDAFSFRMLTERIQEGVIFVDAEGIIQYVNDRFCELTHLKEEDIVGKYAPDAFATNKQHHVELSKRLLERKKGHTERYEIQVKEKEGPLRTLQVSGSPIFDAEGHYVGSVGVHVDITEQKKANDELLRLETAIDSTTDFVTLIDFHGKPLYINKALRDTFNIQGDDNHDQLNFENFYDKASADKLRNEILPEVISEGGWRGELNMRTPGKKIIPVSQVIIGKKDQHNRIYFFASIARDITELKKAQREIAILARFPEENPSPVMRINKQGKILYANQASDLLLNKWKTEPGKKLPKIWAKNISKIMKTGKPREYEVDCGKKIYELKLVPVTGFEYANIIGVDITRRKRAEQKLSESEKKYRAVVEDQTEMISRYTNDGTITFVNNAYCRYFDHEREKVIGTKLFKNIKNKELLQKFKERLATLTKENPAITYNQKIIHKGKEVWQLWTDRAIYDDKGHFIEYQSVGQDITPLKEAEEAIKLQQVYLRQVIDANPHIIYVKDQQGRYILANQAVADFLGKPLEEIVGKTDKELHHKKTKYKPYLDEDNKIVQESTTLVNNEDKVYSPVTNNLHYFQTIKTPLQLPNEKEVQILGVSTDITQRREAEEELKAQIALKELINSISTRFIRIPYHEINSGINEALRWIGEYTEVDGAFITLLNDHGQVSMEHHWLRSSSDDDTLMDLLPRKANASQFSYLAEELEKNGFAYINQVKDLPKAAGNEKTLMKDIKAKSMVVLPLQMKSAKGGHLTLINFKRRKKWTNYNLVLLRLVGQVFSNVIERKSTEELLNFRVEFENLINTISATFINIPAEKIDDEISLSLKYIAEFLGVDQGYIYLTRNNRRNLHMTHSWISDKLKGKQKPLSTISAREQMWVYRQLRNFGVLGIPDLQSVPQGGARIGKLLQENGIRSMILIPIIFHSDFYGVMAFASSKHERFWPEDAVPLLKISGQIFANALERKQTETDLVETKELYRTLAANIPKSTVFIFDKQLRFQLAEGADLESQGYTRDSLEGNSLYDVLPPQSIEMLEPLYKDALRGKTNIIERDFNKRQYLIHFLPVKNNLGEIYAGLVMSIDISDQKTIQRELEIQAQELKRSNEDLEQFAYAASHDLQEPLRMVSSYVHLIQRKLGDDLTPEMDEFMFFAVDGVKRMQELINDLLEYSRVDRKGNPFVPVDMNMILSVVRSNLQQAIQETDAVVEYDHLPTINADQYQMVSLFQNLMENAIKFRGDERPHIQVKAKPEKDGWLFSVKDNGIGIDQKYFDRIFTIFQRLNSRTKYSGTGIGLAICKKIVERHGGTIWGRSEVGKGATFYFEIKSDINGH